MTRKGRSSKPKTVTLAHVKMIEVDNPDFQAPHAGAKGNPRKIMAAYNHRESYVGFLFGKGLINEAEKRAGDKVRQAFEAMGGAGASAIDYSRTKVDGGSISDPITIRQLEAGATLREVHKVLGPKGHDLVLRLCGECLWPHDIVPRSKRTQDRIGFLLKECLDTLAGHFGFKISRTTFYRKAS
jgi:hypothetical protein